MAGVTATQERDVSAPKGDATLRLRVELLDQLMAGRGIRSVAELARLTGISRSTLFRLRAHEVDASGPTAMRLAEIVCVPVESLFRRVA